jgi:hypothetical protein
MKQITLNEQEAQLVLQALAKFPFEQVAGIINSISIQLQDVAPTTKAAPKAKAKK